MRSFFWLRSAALGAVACACAGACTTEHNLGDTYRVGTARWAAALPQPDGAGVGRVPLFEVEDVVIDPAGDLIAVAAGNEAAEVAKYSGQDGTLEWTTAISGKPLDSTVEYLHVAVDGAGQIYVGGSFNLDVTVGGTALSSPVFTAKILELSPAGEYLGMLALDEPSINSESHVRGLAATEDGHVYVTGSFTGSITFPGGTYQTPNGGTYQPYVAAFAPDGTIAWGHPIAYPATLALAPDGGLVLAAAATQSDTFEGTAIDLTTQPTTVAARLAPDGTAAWVRAFGTIGMLADDVGVAVDPDGRVATTTLYLSAGEPPTTSVAMLDADGTPLWSSPPVAADSHLAVAAPTGTAVAGGHILDEQADVGATDRAGTMYLVARDRAGAQVDAVVYGSPGQEQQDDFTTLSALPDGSLAFGAFVLEGVDFGAGSLGGGSAAIGESGTSIVGVLAP